MARGGIFGLLPFAQLKLKHGWEGIQDRKQAHRHAVIEENLSMNHEYTVEHFYAVRCIEMHMLRLLVTVRRKRGKSTATSWHNRVRQCMRMLFVVVCVPTVVFT